LGEEGSLEDFTQKVEDATYIVGHNVIGFDVPALRKVYPDLKIKAKVLDTMVLAKLAYPNLFSTDAASKKLDRKYWGRHSLRAWGERLGVMKDDYQGGFDEWNQEMHDYCRQDVEVTKALFAHLVKCDLPMRAVEIEHDTQELCTSLEHRGVCFDEEAATALYAKLESRRMEVLRELQAEFPTIPPKCLGPYGNQKARMERMLDQDGIPADGWQDEKVRKDMEWLGIKFKWTKPEPFNPNSGQHIAKRMMERGWVPKEYTDLGAPKVDEPVLVDMGRMFAEAKPLAEFVMLQKRIGQVRNSVTRNGWLDHLEEDGRVHGRVNPIGCVSFRCSHSSPNLAQVPAVGKAFGKDCRQLFGVPKGHKLVGVDASGLELRVLAHYLAIYDGGKYAHEVVNGDIHTLNQEAAGLPTRNDAKRFIYALIYGAGDAKLGEIVMPEETSQTKLRRAGKTIRARFNKKLPALKQLTEAVRNKATKTKKLKGLDGRMLHVRSIHSAVNLLLQSAGAIICKRALEIMRVSLEKAGHKLGVDWHLVLFVHDEAQLEVREDIAEDVARIAEQAFRDVGPDLGLKVLTDGEAKIGANWAETH
tara:strand:- start:31875 stop:33635 length:1761 start_codon:yes stop_codon:yes gene_type:complete